MNPADAERVLRAVTTPVTTEDSVYGCGLETARDWALFWCTGGCGVSDDSDELAVVDSVEGLRKASLEVGGLVCTLVVSFPGLLTLRAWISSEHLVGMCVHQEKTFSAIDPRLGT